MTERDIPMLLLANTTASKFYAPHTEYKDSLDSTPSGRALYKEVLHTALRAQDYNALDQITSKTHLYVFKDVVKSSDAAMVPIYNKKKYAKMERKAMLKGTRHARDNSMSMFRAQTGLDLGVSDAPVTEETRQYDFLETDYH